MKYSSYILGNGGLIAIAMGLSVSLFGQDKVWAERIQNPEVNLYEVQAEFNDYWEGREIERGQGYKQYKRWEHFWEPRLAPSGDMVAPDAVYQAVQRNRGSEVRLSQSGVWTYFGNTSVPGSGGGAGRVNMVRVDPSNTLRYYACAPAGGLWRSNNAGTNWEVVNTDQLGSIGVSDVAIDPNDPNTLYIATGDGDAGDTYALGVLKSTDNGVTWNTTGLNWTVQQVRRCNRIIMDPSDSDVLLVATSNGVHRTTDGGANWTQTLGGNFKDVQFKSGDATTVFAVGNGDDFFYSNDNGVTWTQSTTGLPTSGISRLALTVGSSDPNTLYILAGRSSDQGFEGYYRSQDAGLTWTQMASAATINLLGWNVNGTDSGGQAWYDLATACDPTNEDVVYVGGVNTWKSSDGGATWNIVGHWYGASGTPYVHADIHGMYFIPGTSTLLIGCDGGVFRTLNGGTSFSDLSSNLEIAQIYRLGLSAQTQNTVFSGWQDNGSNLKVGNNWTRPIGGDGFESIVDHTDESIMYGTIYYGRIYKSTNYGSSFSTILNSNGTGADEGGAWLTPYVMSENDHNKLIVAKKSLHISTDAGGSWTSYSMPTTGNSNALAVAESDENVIFVGKGGSLYRTLDGGNTWTTLSGLSGSSITYIAIDPTDATRLWVSFSGFGSGAKVYYSGDSGDTWTNYSDGLPAIPCNTIVYQKGTDDGLYVGTDAGVYYRENSFGAWQPYTDGLPNTVVSELEIHYGSNTIVAATYGRGLWHAPLYAIPADDAAIVTVDAPNTTQCDPNVEGIVTIGNFGANTLTAATIEYGLNGAYDQSFAWTGSLATGETEQVNLPADTGTPGTATFVARIVIASDQNNTNDSKESIYEIGEGEIETTITIETDCWGGETTWELRDASTAVIVSGGPLASNSVIATNVCLTDACYEFEIFDSYGDGLNGTAYGCAIDGDYYVTQADGTVLVTMPVVDFDINALHPFCTVPATVLGCTDGSACNYDPAATSDDGSCEYTSCAGCTNPVACNYDATATIDDGACDLVSCYGCADSGACNYDATATNDDGSCEFTSCAGCTDSGACNYDATATSDDSSCEYTTCAGCTDSGACNYDADATLDDGTCEYASCACPMDLNNDGFIGTGDVLAIIGDFGCAGVCNGDVNGDLSTDTSDLLTMLAVFGTACP